MLTKDRLNWYDRQEQGRSFSRERMPFYQMYMLNLRRINMAKYTREDVVRMCNEQDVEFIRLPIFQVH